MGTYNKLNLVKLTSSPDFPTSKLMGGGLYFWASVLQARNFSQQASMLYICVSSWLLAHESRDLSQAETKRALVKSWAKSQNDKYVYIFTDNEDFFQTWPFWVKRVKFLTGLVTTIMFVSAWDKSCDSWANNQKLTQM